MKTDHLLELLRRPYGNLTAGERAELADRIEELEAKLLKALEIIGVYANTTDHWPIVEITYKQVRQWREGLGGRANG